MNTSSNKMVNSFEIIIPLLNPNEREVSIAALHVVEGEHVVKGEIICTIETTKSVSEIAAEQDGYIIGLKHRQGDIASSGDLLCFVADSPDWKPPEKVNGVKSISFGKDKIDQRDQPLPDGMRITNPALEEAAKLGINLELLPKSELITRNRLLQLIQPSDRPKTLIQKKITNLAELLPQKEISSNSLIVYGGGGLGKSLIELVHELSEYEIAGIVDDAIADQTVIIGYRVLGNGEILPALFDLGIQKAVNAVGGIGNIKMRTEVFNKLADSGFTCPSLVHPRSFVETSANISEGVQIFPHAYIGSQARINFGTLVNTAAIISHDCILGEYVNISPGAVLAGMVHVENRVLIGMGVTVNLGVTIGEGTRIGNGATVIQDVPANTIIRAGTIWPG